MHSKLPNISGAQPFFVRYGNKTRTPHDVNVSASSKQQSEPRGQSLLQR